MVVDQVRDFLENGNIRNAVNFPEVSVPRKTTTGSVRERERAEHARPDLRRVRSGRSLNIHDMVNSSRGEVAYTVVDLDDPVPPEIVRKVASIPGVVMTRIVLAPVKALEEGLKGACRDHGGSSKPALKKAEPVTVRENDPKQA